MKTLTSFEPGGRSNNVLMSEFGLCRFFMEKKELAVPTAKIDPKP